MLRVAHIIAVAIVGISAQASAGPTLDHLVPFSPMYEPTLRPLADKKLLITPANCGRMIRMFQGPDIGESAVSVYCAEGHCHVTLTRGARNLDYLWADTAGQRDHLQRVAAVSVSRSDAEIPETTAHAVRECWRAALRATRPPTEYTRPALHNDRIEFWLVESGRAPLKGERSDDPGKNILKLIRLGDQLVHYCGLPLSQRAEAARQIEQEAIRLTGVLAHTNASNQAMERIPQWRDRSSCSR